jgi:hypothetical protein
LDCLLWSIHPAPIPLIRQLPEFAPLGAREADETVCSGLAPGWGQAGPGNIRGQVTDPDGRRIPGAVVSLSNGRVLSRSGTTDVHGMYRLADIPPGAYTVRVSAPAFATEEPAGARWRKCCTLGSAFRT